MLKIKTKSYFSAFTLVELIVVIVILAILATIAFLSFNNYSSSARDSTRLSDISNIAKGLTIQYSIGGYYIIPDNSVNLYSGATQIGYQGKAGTNTLNSIKISANSGKDPLNNTYYTYNTNITKNKYQISGFLENKGSVINRVGFNQTEENGKYKIENNGVNNLIPHLTSPSLGEELKFVILSLSKNPFLSLFGDNIGKNMEQALINNIREIPAFAGMTLNINQINATDYTNRFPYTKGDSIGVILSSTGGTGSIIYLPLEDSGTGIDVSSGSQTSGKVVISNNTDNSTVVTTSALSGYTNTNTVVGTGWSNWDGSKNSSYISLDGADVYITDSVLIDTNKVLITYIKNYKVYGIIGNFDGSTITYSAPTILYSGTDVYQAMFAKLDTNKVLITYRNAGNGYANVLTIAGNTINIGTQFNYSASVTVSCHITALSQTKVLAAYRGSGNTGYAFIFDISGTTITKGSEYSFSTYGDPNGVITTNSTQGIISYIGNTGPGYFSYILVANVSGTTLTFGSPVRLDSSVSNERYPLSIIQIGSYYMAGNGSYTSSWPLELVLFSLAGSTLNIESKLIVYSNGYGIGGSLIKLNNQEVMYISKNTTDSNYEYAKIIGLSGTGLTITNSQKISSEAISNANSSVLIDDNTIFNVYTDTVGWPSEQSKANLLKK